MANPGSTITITLEALTDQAQAKLDGFLKDINARVTVTNSGLASVSRKASSEVESVVQNAAKKTTTHIAGMTFAFRSAIDGIRAAAAGGGSRAIFYSIDEAVRALIASGVGLSILVPVLAAVAAAVGGGYLVWREYTSATRAAEKATKDLHDSIQGTAEVFKQMQQLQKAGLISPEAFQRNIDILTGKIKLFKDAEGSVTQSATSPTSTQGIVPGSPRTFQNQNAPLTGPELVKYLQEQLAVPGGLDAEQVTAQNKAKQLRDEIHAKAISDTEEEIQKTREKFQAERDALDAQTVVQGKLLTNKERQQNAEAKILSLQNEQVEINRIRQEQADRIAEATNKTKSEFAAAANERLDKELDASAAAQTKTREQIYQEEFEKRIALLSLLKLTGFLNESQYTEAVQQATTKRLQGVNAETAANERLHAEILKMRQDEARAAAEEIVRNPSSSQGAKEKAIQYLIEETQRRLEQNQTQLELNDNDEKGLELLRERAQLERQLGAYQVQQLEQDKTINAAREQGVVKMFGNMAAASKAFGREGVAAYKGFAIAQATIDTAKAAIGAYSSVVGIPYVGPFLAPIAAAAALAAGAAQIGAIESASGYLEGGYTGAGPADEVAGVVHRGEFVIPADRVKGNMAFLESIRNGSLNAGPVPSSSPRDAQPGPGGSTINHETNLHLAVVDSEESARRVLESEDGEKFWLSMADKHISKYQR